MFKEGDHVELIDDQVMPGSQYKTRISEATAFKHMVIGAKFVVISYFFRNNNWWLQIRRNDNTPIPEIDQWLACRFKLCETIISENNFFD